MSEILTAEQTRDLREAAQLARSRAGDSINGTVRARYIALADRLDSLAATIDLRDAVIEAAVMWRNTWPLVVVDEGDSTTYVLIAAVDALRQSSEARR